MPLDLLATQAHVSNVAHAQFAGVRVANSEPFSFDEPFWSVRRSRRPPARLARIFPAAQPKTGALAQHRKLRIIPETTH
jgi:hypothetical protein